MVTCPYCSNEIEKLHCVMTETRHYSYFFFDGDIEYNRKHLEDENIEYEFTCPTCDQEICKTESDAINFLLGSYNKTKKICE